MVNFDSLTKHKCFKIAKIIKENDDFSVIRFCKYIINFSNRIY
jgi:hypothetical protein